MLEIAGAAKRDRIDIGYGDGAVRLQCSEELRILHAAQHPACFKDVLGGPVPHKIASGCPLAIVLMGIVGSCIMLNQRLTYVSSASVQNQAVVNRGSASQAAEVKVAGSASEVCAGWLCGLYVSVTTK